MARWEARFSSVCRRPCVGASLCTLAPCHLLSSPPKLAPPPLLPPPLPQINSALNKLDLGPAPGLSSLTSLSLLDCHLAAGPSLLQHFNTLPALRRLEALFEGLSYFTSMPLGGTDKAGRAVTARLAAGRRLELVRELPMIEE